MLRCDTHVCILLASISCRMKVTLSQSACSNSPCSAPLKSSPSILTPTPPAVLLLSRVHPPRNLPHSPKRML